MNSLFRTPLRLIFPDSGSTLEKDFLLSSIFADDLSIRQLAGKVGVNSRTLQDSFKFLYGKTIFEYVQALRIARAKELLKTTDLTTERFSVL